jgi:hypothetical protein
MDPCAMLTALYAPTTITGKTGGHLAWLAWFIGCGLVLLDLGFEGFFG